MSAGIEKLKTSIRIWWKIDGKRERETLYNTPPTAENIKQAQATADMIALVLLTRLWLITVLLLLFTLLTLV